jgi:phenylacetate-CoA ligase
LVGRLEDVVVGPDGRQMVRFHGLFVDVPHLIEGQVIQEETDLLRLRIVATDSFGPEHERLLRDRVTRERLGPMRVLVERVPSIERTERGKFRAVISRMSTGPSGGAYSDSTVRRPEGVRE